MMRSSSPPKEAYLSTPIAKAQYVYITEDQFKQISTVISQDASLVEALMDFRARWIEANESDDPNAFAGSIDKIDKIKDIIATITNDPESTLLTSPIVLRYLELR